MTDNPPPPHRLRDRLFAAWRVFEGILLAALFLGAIGAIAWGIFSLMHWNLSK